MKKKGIIILVAVIAVIVLIVSAVIGTYNGMVTGRETVETAASAISTDIQARADKIPNLVAVVKDYADYEQSTLTAVIEARTAVQKAQTPNEQVAAAEDLNRAVDIWVNALTEAYPDLKANEQYKSLMDTIEGTENRISTSRKRYNEAVKTYNTSIKKFPKNIFASMFGFEAYEYFETTSGAEAVPDVGGLLNE